MSSINPPDVPSDAPGVTAAPVPDKRPSDRADEADPQLGVVVIGRNEGPRLETCLTSLRAALPNVVYVDSGSSDGSVAFARSLGCRVVELDMSLPFTAARRAMPDLPSWCCWPRTWSWCNSSMGTVKS